MTYRMTINLRNIMQWIHNHIINIFIILLLFHTFLITPHNFFWSQFSIFSSSWLYKVLYFQRTLSYNVLKISLLGVFCLDVLRESCEKDLGTSLSIPSCYILEQQVCKLLYFFQEIGIFMYRTIKTNRLILM